MKYKFNLENYLEDLEEIVNIDSFSKSNAGTEKIAKLFRKKYDDLGFDTELHYKSNEVGPCLVASNCENEESDILLIGHMDTVFEMGTAKKRPFRIENNIAYGPGVVDMKSGLLNIYYALKSLDEEEKLPRVRILHNSDEEISSIYSEDIIKYFAKKSKCVVVLEPARSNGSLVYERKGIAKYKAEFKGIAAHPGINPEKGSSAINELAHFIIKISELSNLEIGTFVNVGIIKGGIASNIISDFAQCEIDLRYDSMKELKRIEDNFKYIIKNPKDENIKIEIKKISQRSPMILNSQNKKIVDIIEKISKENSLNISGVKTGGGSDANITSSLNIPTVDGLGPVGGDAHSEKEYLEIGTIEERMNLLKEVVKYFN